MTEAFGRTVHIPRRRCGRTGLTISALGLGLEGLARGFGSSAELRPIMHQALECNINHVDVASGDPIMRQTAEVLLGGLFERELKRHREDLIITAAAGGRAWPGPYGAGGGRKHILSSLDRTLGRLGLDYVDVLCVGPLDRATPLCETMNAVGDAIRAGKALYAGISSYTTDQTREAIELLDGIGVRLAVHHALSEIFLRNPEGTLAEVLETHGVGAIRHLCRPVAARPLLRRQAMLSDLARERGQTPTQLSIAWLMQQHTVASVSSPTASAEHLMECAAAFEQLSFTDRECARLGGPL